MSEHKGLFDLSGRVALVTGGGHGLGRAFCEGLAEYGADVVCADINFESAQETAEVIKGLGRRAIPIKTDVTQKDQVDHMVSQVLSEFGSFDILFANAGAVPEMIPLHEQSLDHWHKLVNVNLTGTFLCLQAALPIMQKQGRGSIICTSSIAGISTLGQPVEAGLYGAAKAGVSMLVRYAARAYASNGIRINAIAPGLHDTRNVTYDSAVYESLLKELATSIPMKRYAKPEEIKGLAIFLASDASSFITGQTIASDGGTSA